MVMRYCGSLIPWITLRDQLADIASYSGLILAPFQRHGQYLGRRGFFLPTIVNHAKPCGQQPAMAPLEDGKPIPAQST